MGTKWWCFFLFFLGLFMDECMSLNLEGKALYALKERVEIDPYGVLNNWDQQSSVPCSWRGVHCLAGQVDILNLTGMALVGTLAPEIGKLATLRSLVLSDNNFYGMIPKEIGELKKLEVLDLGRNKLNEEIPLEVSDIPSLKQLILCGNGFQDQADDSNEEYEGLASCVSRKVDCALRPTSGILHAYGQTDESDSHSIKQPDIMQYSQDSGNHFRRKLIQQIYNLPTLLGNSDLPIIMPGQDFQILTASGAFPASTNSKKQTYITSSINNNPSSGVPIDLTAPYQQPQQSNSKTPSDYQGKSEDERKSGKWNPGKWIRYFYIPVSVFLCASLIFATVVMCRRQGQTTIGPWRTGISGQLQKAFIMGLSGQLRKALVTGVPKLNKTELEVACEDFSNIIDAEPDYTVFKGTLSSGTEIAVISTVIASPKDWPKSSESCFQRKIELLSRVNHKNFVNLLGYCEEEEPFMRMMVLEYAPNTLSDHLHIKEFEHLGWEVRMRIIMGMSYCLQHMHHELNPPVTLPSLQSNTVFLTDDYAAKLTDMSLWKEVIRKRNLSKDGESDLSESAKQNCAMNIYNFGLVLLEIISGKLPQQEDGGASLLSWASQYLNDGWERKQLLDTTLNGFEANQLEIICEVIKECVKPNSHQRPTMREITQKLRRVIDVSPEAAYPRLSPLWWAELEILTVEAC
ncbi:hypothetical protein LUZ60_009634 [Juncus effusus]|nr:hypothetical protein LUZ60_009634 [Juncus effusus]